MKFFLYLYALQQQQEITVFDWSVGLVGTINKKNKTKKQTRKKKMHSTNYTISGNGDAHIIISRGVFRTLPNI